MERQLPPNNNTTGLCSPIKDIEAYLSAKAPQNNLVFNQGGNNYTFSREHCVPFSLYGYDGISWIPAINNNWQFFVRISDPQGSGCSNEYNFYYKLCKQSPYAHPMPGNNANYWGNLYCPQPNWLRVYITDQRPLEFEVLAYTNCSSCICNAGNAGCNFTTQYNGNSQWSFKKSVVLTADDVNYYASAGNLSIEVGVLKPEYIHFNCNTNYSCP